MICLFWVWVEEGIHLCMVGGRVDFISIVMESSTLNISNSHSVLVSRMILLEGCQCTRKHKTGGGGCPCCYSLLLLLLLCWLLYCNNPCTMYLLCNATICFESIEEIRFPVVWRTKKTTKRKAKKKKIFLARECFSLPFPFLFRYHSSLLPSWSN